jgi:hypothetical protein
MGRLLRVSSITRRIGRCRLSRSENDKPVDVDIDINFVLDACKNLLDVKESSNEVVFAHLSFQEYFEKPPDGLRSANLVTEVYLMLLNHPD